MTGDPGTPAEAGTAGGAAPDEHARARRRRQAGTGALALGALGVVFGDIGTSPLYALQTVFSANDNAVRATTSDVYGVISLVFWTITMIVSVKFVLLIMRADNDGEGGILALLALVRDAALRNKRVSAVLVAAGLVGVALFYGDGMITPAVSVLSAVEGLEVVDPDLDAFVVPITIAVLTVLFAFQRRGTQAIGRLFGPVMAVWFAVLAAAGLAQVLSDPEIVGALSPHHAVAFFADHPGIAFFSLGSVILTVTGAEALYADMGHFGRRPIRRVWFLIVFPALTLNYMGQGALILETPSAISNPFYLMLPGWSRIPVVLLATLATVIASQAVISGAFSVTRQAVQLGYLPRLAIRHTSAKAIGQVYVPAVNWGLFVAVVALVIGFGSSAALASAYGIAVTGTMAIDTLLFLVVVRMIWHKPLALAIAGAAIFLTIDLAFLVANLPKVASGGWFPLLIGLIVFIVLSTWDRGRRVVIARRAEQEGALEDFLGELAQLDPPVHRVPGTGVYLNLSETSAPLAMRESVDIFRTIHEDAVIVSVETTTTPYAKDAERVTVRQLGFPGVEQLAIRLGFLETFDVPELLALARERGLRATVDPDHVSYFVSKLALTSAAGRRRWRERLFVAMARNAASPVDYFGLPRERTVIMGARVDVRMRGRR